MTTSDHEQAIRARLHRSMAALDMLVAPAYYDVDVAHLLAEVERLRGQVSELLPWAVVDHDVDGNCHDGEGLHCETNCHCGVAHGSWGPGGHHTHDDDLSRRISSGEFGPVS